MKLIVSTIAAAALAGAVAMPVAAQTINDYGLLTCADWNMLDEAAKLQAAQGMQAFVKESANHDVAGAATELLDGKTVEEAEGLIDNGCTNNPALGVIAAVIAN